MTEEARTIERQCVVNFFFCEDEGSDIPSSYIPRADCQETKLNSVCVCLPLPLELAVQLRSLRLHAVRSPAPVRPEKEPKPASLQRRRKLYGCFTVCPTTCARTVRKEQIQAVQETCRPALRGSVPNEKLFLQRQDSGPHN